MLTTLKKALNSFFMIVLLLLSAPTLIFLTKWYYANLVTKKAYVGVIDMPKVIEKSEEIITAAKTLLASSDVRAVVINCDGLGGNAGACEAIHSDIVKLKQIFKKPVLAYIEDFSFAGSYFIATAADFIVGSQGARIGFFATFLQKESQLIPETREELSASGRGELKGEISLKRKQIQYKTAELLERAMISGEQMKELGLIDFVGGHLEVERVMRSKTVIEGLVEKVHGSFLEHFIFYASDLVRRIIKSFNSSR
jgi:ClpP class serine protease